MSNDDPSTNDPARNPSVIDMGTWKDLPRAEQISPGMMSLRAWGLARRVAALDPVITDAATGQQVCRFGCDYQHADGGGEHAELCAWRVATEYAQDVMEQRRDAMVRSQKASLSQPQFVVHSQDEARLPTQLEHAAAADRARELGIDIHDPVTFAEVHAWMAEHPEWVTAHQRAGMW